MALTSPSMHLRMIAHNNNSSSGGNNTGGGSGIGRLDPLLGNLSSAGGAGGGSMGVGRLPLLTPNSNSKDDPFGLGDSSAGLSTGSSIGHLGLGGGGGLGIDGFNMSL
jgi:hypothetical protein